MKANTFTPLLIGLCLMFLETLGVQVDIDSDKAPKLSGVIPQLQSSIEDFYTQASNYLVYDGYTPPQQLKMHLIQDKKYNGGLDIVSGSEEYWVGIGENAGSTLNDAGIKFITQTTAWSVEHFPPPPTAPDWLTQCIAAYARYYIWDKETARPSKPDKDVKSPKSAGPDGCSYWLNFVVQNYPSTPDPVQQVFKITREGNYKDGAWQDITGKSGKDLWTEMQNSGRKRAISATIKYPVD